MKIQPKPPRSLPFYWGVYDDGGDLWHWMIDSRRTDLRRRIERHMMVNYDKDWRQLYREGWRIRKVCISPGPDGAAAR